MTSGKTGKEAALVIDIQNFEGMDRSDAQAFSDALGQRLESFRQSGVQPVWVAIAPGGAKLVVPESGHDTGPRDPATLESLGFDGHLPGKGNRDVFENFLRDHGPRNNEVVYRKPSMSALDTIEDSHVWMKLLEESGTKLESRRNPAEDHPDTRYIQPEQAEAEFRNLFAGGNTLHDYLAAEGVRKNYVMGAVSKYCVSETALSSAAKGYQTEILSNLALSWTYPVSGATRGNGRLVWGGFDHQELVRDAVRGALTDPARGYTDAQKQRIAALDVISGPDRADGTLSTAFRHQGRAAASPATIAPEQGAKPLPQGPLSPS